MNHKEEEWCFFKWLGEAVSRWALIEHELYALAVVVLKPKDRFVLWDAYTGIENFRSKLAFVDRAILKGVTDKSLKDEWDSLKKKVAKQQTLRNQLVHRVCISYPQSTIGGRTISLEPNFREKEPLRRRPEPPNDAMCVKEIHAISDGFHDVFWLLVVFAHKVAGKGLPLGPPQRSNRPKSFRDIKRHMYEELSMPQKSSASKRAAKKPEQL